MNGMLFIKKKDKWVIPLCVLLIAGVLAASATPCRGSNGGSKKKGDTQITVSDIQASLMSYADILSTVMGQISLSLKENELPPDVRMQILTDMASTVFAVYTNAADPDPLMGLLNTAVVVSFGKMIYEQHWHKKYGKPMDIVVNGFRGLEIEIWKTVSQVLNAEQKTELRNMILKRRKAYPDLLDFTQLRFNDFESIRKESTLESKVKSGGLLAPVSDATKQIEETRRFAERALYLSTRLPLTAGVFMDVWLSRWLTNPDVKNLTTDLKKMSTAAHELTSLVEKLPDQVQQVGTTTANQVMDRIAEERRNLIRDLGTEQQRLSGLLTQFHQTVDAGKALITSMHGLAGQVGVSPENPLTFDMDVYKKTVKEMRGAATEMTSLVEALNQLAESPEMQKWLPLMKNGIEQFAGESRKMINHIFLMALLIIVLSTASFFVLRLAYVYALKRFKVNGP